MTGLGPNGVPSLVVVVQLEGDPVVLVDAATAEQEARLRDWVGREPLRRKVCELLALVGGTVAA